MRYLYSFLFYLTLPFIFLRLIWRSRRAPLYRKRLGERLGFYPWQLKNCIWVHAVSMGETIAAVPLIKSLQLQYPQSPVLVTNMTVTGSERVKAILGDTVYNAYIPYDVPDAIARFFQQIKPRILIVMETELWPNLFLACQQRHIPIVIANARLSEKSAKGYQIISSLTKKLLGMAAKILVQNETDAERFIALGASKEKVYVAGSLKFDLQLPADITEKSENLRKKLGEERLIWIAASTHPGEDEIVLAAHHAIRKKFSNALLMLVPRHPERFDAVATLVRENNFIVVRRSDNAACDNNTAVYLGDTMGEMMLMFSVCDVAFVAGSFAMIGGHNVIEPAILHKPVITGPHVFNFAEVTDLLLAAKGMVKINHADELAETVSRFFSDPEYCQKIGENAWQVVEKNRGALQRQLESIVTILSLINP